jgi:RNA recognition motif-containing protein
MRSTGNYVTMRAVKKKTRIFIGRLSRGVTSRDLNRAVTKFGEVKEVDLKTGYAFVV